ncbi:hypothetical protein ACHAPT_012932 [Fusarium lateritium]
MLAGAIAAAATALWLFQFSRDAKVSERAREDLTKCDAFLSRVAQTWPHISLKLGTLRNLQALAEEIRSQSSDQDTTISFQPAWFWALLVPKVCNYNAAESQGSEERPEGTGNSICLKSHFVMPLNEDHEKQPPDSNIHAIDSLLAMPEDLELFDIESLSFDFVHNSFWEQGL